MIQFSLSEALFGRWKASFPSRNNLRAGATSSVAPIVEYGGENPPERALILMDAFCRYHGDYLAARAQDYPGTAVIHVLGDYLYGYLQSTQPDEQWENMRLPKDNEIDEWKKNFKDMKLVGVYCESDSGLEDAEQLREQLEVQCQDTPVVLPARRDKYLMNEKVGEAGLAVAKQKLCRSVESAKEFANELLAANERVVVKPRRGVASESVYLCENLQDVEDAWNKITQTAVFGSRGKHETVLVQEYLSGTEYAVDIVSRDGQHKVAAVWRYDKRPVNEAAFCYFKTELVDENTDPNVSGVCDYAESALSALGVKWGLSHNEVIVTERGPMLVEVNCRQHNMDFAPLAMACIGYNALDLALEAFLGSRENWDGYPDHPSLRAFGCMAHLVNYKTGRLMNMFHFGELNDLPSVLDWEVYENFATPGLEIQPTVDIRSDAGWVQMINDDREALLRDFEQIVEWMPTMFQVDEDN